jgi:hypothetical protein
MDDKEKEKGPEVVPGTSKPHQAQVAETSDTEDSTNEEQPEAETTPPETVPTNSGQESQSFLRRRLAETSNTEDSSDGGRPGRVIYIFNQEQLDTLRELNVTYTDLGTPVSGPQDIIAKEKSPEKSMQEGWVLPERPLTAEERNGLGPVASLHLKDAQWLELKLPHIEEQERKAQPPRRRSTITEYDDEIVVIEYDPPKDGLTLSLKGITKIPRRFTNAQDLESLGWYNYELKVTTSRDSINLLDTG